jgi:hypothetical protein
LRIIVAPVLDARLAMVRRPGAELSAALPDRDIRPNVVIFLADGQLSFAIAGDPAVIVTGVVLYTPAGLLGDYNVDNIVDAADYVVWPNALGLTGSGLAADCNGNNVVDSGDYTVWRANFGATAKRPAWRRDATRSLPQRGYIPQPRVGPEFVEGPTLGRVPHRFRYAESVTHSYVTPLCDAFSVEVIDGSNTQGSSQGEQSGVNVCNAVSVKNLAA